LGQLQRVGQAFFQASPSVDLAAQAGHASHQLLCSLGVLPEVRRGGLTLKLGEIGLLFA